MLAGLAIAILCFVGWLIAEWKAKPIVRVGLALVTMALACYLSASYAAVQKRLALDYAVWCLEAIRDAESPSNSAQIRSALDEFQRQLQKEPDRSTALFVLWRRLEPLSSSRQAREK